MSWLAAKLRSFCYLCAIYCFLGLFFLVYLWTLLYFGVDRNRPKLTGKQSGLRLNPGLALVPLERSDHRLIHCKPDDERMTSEYVNGMEAFLLRYQEGKAKRGRVHECQPEQLKVGINCQFDVNAGGPCNYDSSYGYDSGEVCIVLKLNNVYGWVPDPVNSTDRGVRVRCTGQEPIDDQLLGPVCFYDLRWYREGEPEGDGPCPNDRDFGLLDAMFFPYLNKRWYESPLVFVQFPQVTRHVLIRVKCWAEAKNIHVDWHNDEGSITFQLLVD
ncbi:ATPase, Na K transporting, beta [Cichlidogyrus casuarinus]|uniref:ATPase, Na K transporting, beta n=1 Tax=Cichlidogyrus casuarinus TaxID=1844966 RepID=A0ABD2PSN6_9PLAT